MQAVFKVQVQHHGQRLVGAHGDNSGCCCTTPYPKGDSLGALFLNKPPRSSVFSLRSPCMALPSQTHQTSKCIPPDLVKVTPAISQSLPHNLSLHEKVLGLPTSPGPKPRSILAKSPKEHVPQRGAEPSMCWHFDPSAYCWSAMAFLVSSLMTL